MKRVVRLFPIVMITTFLLCTCICTVAYLLLKTQNSSEERTKLQIGVVGNIDNEFYGFGISAAQSLDTSRYILNLQFMEEEQAIQQLHDGILTAYVVLPDELIDAWMYGRNDVKVNYVSSEGERGLTSMIMAEIVESITPYLTTSQTANYAMQTIVRRYNPGIDVWPYIDDMNLKYIAAVLGREKMCEIEVVGIGNNLSTIAYYFCGVLVVYLMLAGINYSPFFTGRRNELSKILIAKGQKIYQQVLGEWLAFLALTYALLTVLFAVAFGVLKSDVVRIAEWGSDGSGRIWLLLLQMIPVMIMISLFQFMLFELVPGIVGNVLLQFVLSVGMGYISGCFYPNYFFPEILQKIGSLLPTGVACRYMGNCIAGHPVWESLGLLVLYSVIMAAVILRARRYHIEND